MRTYTKTARKKNMLSDEELLEKMELAKSGDADAILTVYTEMWDYFLAWYKTNYTSENFNLRYKISDIKQEFYFHTLKTIESYDENAGASVRTFFFLGFKNFLFHFFETDNNFSLYFKKKYGTKQMTIDDEETGEQISSLQSNELSVEETLSIKQMKNEIKKRILTLKQKEQHILNDYLFNNMNVTDISKKYEMSREGTSLNISNSLKKLGLNENIRRIKSTIPYYKRAHNKILLDAREKREKNKKQK